MTTHNQAIERTEPESTAGLRSLIADHRDKFGDAFESLMQKLAVGILLVNLYAGPALAQSLCSGTEGGGGGEALSSLLNTFFSLGFSIGALGVAVTFFGSTLALSFSFLSQDQEEQIKRTRKQAFGSFGMLFIGAIALSIGFSQLGVLDCIQLVPFQ